MFTIFDEGLTGVYKKLPQDCHLVARDAANGVLLWKVPMRGWQPEFGTGVGGRWNVHLTIPRRLVAACCGSLGWAAPWAHSPLTRAGGRTKRRDAAAHGLDDSAAPRRWLRVGRW